MSTVTLVECREDEDMPVSWSLGPNLAWVSWVWIYMVYKYLLDLTNQAPLKFQTPK